MKDQKSTLTIDRSLLKIALIAKIKQQFGTMDAEFTIGLMEEIKNYEIKKPSGSKNRCMDSDHKV